MAVAIILYLLGMYEGAMLCKDFIFVTLPSVTRNHYSSSILYFFIIYRLKYSECFTFYVKLTRFSARSFDKTSIFTARVFHSCTKLIYKSIMLQHMVHILLNIKKIHSFIFVLQREYYNATFCKNWKPSCSEKMYDHLPARIKKHFPLSTIRGIIKVYLTIY